MDTLGKLDELIELIDGPCGCEDGTCRICRIMGLLFSVRDDLAAQSSSDTSISGLPLKKMY